MKKVDFVLDDAQETIDVMEAFVGGEFFVSIRRHDVEGVYVWEYVKHKLPDGFEGIQQALLFTTQTLVGIDGVAFATNFGEVVERSCFDSFFACLNLLNTELVDVLRGMET